MNAWNVLMSVLTLAAVPTGAGYAVCTFCRARRSVAACFLGGTFAVWALIQCVSVPMTLLRLGFVPLVWVVSALIGALCLLGVAEYARDRGSNRAGRREPRPKAWRAEEVIALVALVAGYLFLAWNFARFQHIDIDDSRFVVTAVDIENTNRLYLTDYGTGNAMSAFVATMKHDLFSPWAVYMALVARLTATPVAIVAHSVIPQQLILCALSAWLLLSGQLFKGRRFEQYGATLLILLLTLYTKATGYTSESFFLRRPWQGKSVVANVGIPALYLALTGQALPRQGWRPYLPIYTVALAMCLMSAMGIIMCCLLCGAFGLAYGIRSRSAAVALKTWGGALICLGYVGVMLALMT